MNKKVLTTIGIILGLTVVVGWFYIASQSQNNADLTQTDTEHKEIKQNNNQKNNQENQENEIKELKAENIDTSNWKEYCNKEYGFCVKYPEGWKYHNSFSHNSVFGIFFNNPKEKYWFEGTESDHISMSVECNSDYDLLTVLLEKKKKYNNFKVSKIKLDDHLWYAYDGFGEGFTTNFYNVGTENQRQKCIVSISSSVALDNDQSKGKIKFVLFGMAQSFYFVK